MRLLSLFSGIGGFELAASWVWGDDLEIVAFCETNKQCREVLQRHYPGVKCYGDIRTEEITDSADIITGGDPCPAHSKARGTWKTRKPDLSGYFLAVVGRLRPRWVVRENVSASTVADFAAGMEALRYGSLIVSMDAHPYTGQRRLRHFVVGHSDATGAQLRESFSQFDNVEGPYRPPDQTQETLYCLTTHRHRYDARDNLVWEPSRGLRLLGSAEYAKASGFPEDWLAGFAETACARMYGNCVVPACAQQIFEAIKAAEQHPKIIADCP